MNSSYQTLTKYSIPLLSSSEYDFLEVEEDAIPEKSKVRLLIGGRDCESKEEICVFHHLDGMYFYITTENGSAVHLAAGTSVKLVEGVYEIDSAKEGETRG